MEGSGRSSPLVGERTKGEGRGIAKSKEQATQIKERVLVRFRVRGYYPEKLAPHVEGESQRDNLRNGKGSDAAKRSASKNSHVAVVWAGPVEGV